MTINRVAGAIGLSIVLIGGSPPSLALAQPTTVEPVDSSRNWPRLPE